jgi:hypothetical protein
MHYTEHGFVRLVLENAASGGVTAAQVTISTSRFSSRSYAALISGEGLG